MKLLKELIERPGQRQRQPEEKKIIRGDVVLSAEFEKLEYEGYTINGNFDFSLTKIGTLKGSPDRVHGYYSAAHTKKITSLDGAPSWVGDNFVIFNTGIESLHNIHKQIKHIGRTLALPETLKSHVLGVMLIKGLKSIVFYNITHIIEDQEKLQEIINKHLAGDRDVHACQEELIEAGLKEFARL